jgi:hypothetical protein
MSVNHVMESAQVVQYPLEIVLYVLELQMLTQLLTVHVRLATLMMVHLLVLYAMLSVMVVPQLLILVIHVQQD